MVTACIVLDILRRVQEALTAAKGIEAADWAVIAYSSRSATAGATAAAIAASSETTWPARGAKLLSRRYELSERQVLRITNAPSK